MTTAQQNGRRGKATAKGELDALKDDVGELAGTAAERGWSFVEAARASATDYADQRKTDAARSVGDLAGALRTSSSSFEDRPNIRAVIDSAADGLDQLAGTIGERSFGELYAEAESVARRSPATAAIAGAAIGFLVARLIKASSETLRDIPSDLGREVARGGRAPARESRPPARDV